MSESEWTAEDEEERMIALENMAMLSAATFRPSQPRNRCDCEPMVRRLVHEVTELRHAFSGQDYRFEVNVGRLSLTWRRK